MAGPEPAVDDWAEDSAADSVADAADSDDDTADELLLELEDDALPEFELQAANTVTATAAVATAVSVRDLEFLIMLVPFGVGGNCGPTS